MIFLPRAKATFFLSFCFVNALFCQNFNESYSPIRNYRPSTSIVNEVSLSYKNEIKTLRSENSKAQKAIKESLYELSESFIEFDSMHLLMHTDTITSYLYALVNRIKAQNPSIQDREFKLFLYRTFSPNASSRGNGILFINLDLT